MLRLSFDQFADSTGKDGTIATYEERKNNEGDIDKTFAENLWGW